MKKFVYSPAGKAVLLVLQQVLVGIMVLSVCFGTLMLMKGGDSLFSGQGKYEQSIQFDDAFMSGVYDTIWLTDYKYNFETDGVYNPKKIVDIEDYALNGRITGEVTRSIGYYLEDLVKWGRQGKENESYNNTQDAAETSDAGGVSYSSVTASKAADDSVTVQGVQEYYKFDESYPPVGDVSLEEYLEQHPEVNPSKMYGYLSNAIDNAYNGVEQYKWNLAKYQEDKSNLRYTIVNRTTGKAYSNISGIHNAAEADEAVQSIRELGAYIYLDSASLNFEKSPKSNIDSFNKALDQAVNGWSYKDSRVTMENIYRNLNQLSALAGGDYTIAVGVDTSYPVHDGFYESKIEYEQTRPWFQALMYGGLIALFLYIIVLVALTVVSGKRADDDEIHLSSVDNIPTEFVLACIAALGVFVVFAAVMVLNTMYNVRSLIILSAITVSILADLLLMAGYLCLVRKIKGGIFWKKSILGWFFGTLYGGARGIRSNVRLLVSYLGFLLIDFLLALFMIQARSRLSLLLFGLLALGFNAFVGALLLREEGQRSVIMEGIQKIRDGDLDYKLDTESLKDDNLKIAQAVNNIGEGLQNAVADSMKNERLKTDLITNVSHDIKTPLTSIINYVDLLKREHIQNEKISGYIRILDEKSQRLKQLTEDLVEASKVSSGNITLNFEHLNFVELINQTTAEFTEKFEAKDLQLIENLPKEAMVVRADGRRLYRVLDNLFNNVAKYALSHTRVYVDLTEEDRYIRFSIKNISEHPLNIRADELTERFIRGDVSRSTEGSGLGLSIAKNLTELQNGNFEIYLDGDLFRVTISFIKVEGKREDREREQNQKETQEKNQAEKQENKQEKKQEEKHEEE